MKRAVVLSLSVLLVSVALWAQTKPAAPVMNLETVLTKMDATAAAFKTLEANLVWDAYAKVVNEHDYQKGKIYFQRRGKNIEMAADFTEPAQKYVLFSNGIARVYEPRIDQVTEYNAGKNREAFESFLVLGFGGSGHELLKSYDVKFAGMENVEGVNAAKLELAPKSAKVRSMFSQITLWIDPARGISVQQQFIEPSSGDYRLAKYSDIKMNQPVPDSVFKLKTTSNTKVVRPQG
jgi:outer membrane lipoprotein-sorting protein